MSNIRIECGATFVGTCTIPGSLSESHVFECVRNLISSQHHHQQHPQHNKCSLVEPSKSSSTPAQKEENDNCLCVDSENSEKRNSWTVSIEANELMWCYADNELTKTSVPQASTCSRAQFSSILFCYLDAQMPKVIVWVLTKKHSDNGNNNNNGKIETEALVWQCLNEKDAIHLRDAYKLIRSRKKLEKIEAINKAIQKNSEKIIGNHMNHKINEIKDNENNFEAANILSEKLEVNEQNNAFIVSQQQQMGATDSNEVLNDLLYRSCKHNPNRETLIASSIDRNSRNNKSQTRQREPALLLHANSNKTLAQPSKSAHPSPSLSSTQKTTNNIIPIIVPVPGHNNYWNQYPSESEFDTTRINSYLNAINLNRRNRKNVPSTGAQQTKLRSRSVEAPLNRLRMSIHKPIGSILTAISSPMGTINGGSANSRNSPSRAVLVTRSESLNSEGSSLSGESGICEFGSANSHPVRSVLKKSSSPTTPTVRFGQNLKKMKNVTFSAYATIQVMDG